MQAVDTKALLSELEYGKSVRELASELLHGWIEVPAPFVKGVKSVVKDYYDIELKVKSVTKKKYSGRYAGVSFYNQKYMFLVFDK